MRPRFTIWFNKTFPPHNSFQEQAYKNFSVKLDPVFFFFSHNKTTKHISTQLMISHHV